MTAAVKACVLPACTVALPGEMETAIACKVMFATPNFDVSANEVAVMVTATSFAGGLAGAW
jgi:hypothetical protein